MTEQEQEYIPVSDIKAESLEQDPNPEFSIDGDPSNIFESEGKGRVLRHRFSKVYTITGAEITSNQNNQLFRINSQNYQTLKAKETAVVKFDPPITGKTIDIILLGSSFKDAKNSIIDVKYRGFTAQNGKVGQDVQAGESKDNGDIKDEDKLVSVAPEKQDKKVNKKKEENDE